MHTDVETKCAAKAARVRHMSREDETSLLDLHVNAEEICKNRQIGVNMKEIMELVRYTKISYLRKQIKCFIWVLLNTLLTLIYPSCISFVIDHGVEKRDMSTVVNSVVILLLLGLLIILTNYIQQLKYTKLGREICEKLKNRIFQKLCNTNYKFWSKNRVGDILTVINTDISSVEKLFTTTINNAILNSLYFLGIIIILFLLNYVIGIWISILLIGFMILQRKNGKKIKNGMTELRTKMGIFNSNTQEMISNMPDIQLIYPNNKLQNTYYDQNHQTNILYFQQVKNILKAKNIGIGFNTLSVFVALLVGAAGVLNGTMSVGNLFSVVIYVQQLYSPAIALGDAYNTMKNTQPNIKRILDLLENKDVIKCGPLIPEKRLNGKISFKHVTFSYGDSNRNIFTDVNLDLEAGKVYGIIGDNGKGKSTFIRLIAGLCIPDSGTISIDDININTYDIEYLRNHIGYLTQKPLLLSGETVIDYTQEKKILNKFYLKDDIKINDNGMGISGGENQKLALVHLLNERTKDIFILDEPTASVDLKSEEVICNQIKDILRGKTVLIITHRTNVLKICDEIIDFNKIESYKNVRIL